MNLFNRLLGAVIALKLMMLGILLGAVVLGWVTAFNLGVPLAFATALDEYMAGPGFRYTWGPVGAVTTLVAGFALLVAEVRVPRPPREVVLKEDRLGSVAVSLPGLRKLAEHVVGEVAGVEAVHAQARHTRNGLHFRCRIQVKPEVSTPDLAEEVRARLSGAVENHVGQTPARIDILTSVQALQAPPRRVR